jgi:putative zinc finger protein
MNCRRCEHLMPLYVEGDLKSGLADQVSEHLDWCGKCNWLFDEYKESQSWLRSPSAPEFGDAELSALKAGILKRVAETTTRPSLFANLMQHWDRRQVFALSTAALIIAGVVLLYVFQTRVKIVVPIPQQGESRPNEGPKQPGESALADDTERASGPGVNKRHRQPKRRYIKAGRSEPALARRVVEPNGSEARSAAETTRVPTVDSSARFAGAPAVLRIEIQTSDPNIRIIWFAPKETDSHQAKPATD